MTLVLVRHASAGDRSEWEGDDRLRPLDKRGRKQAARLPDLLEDIPIGRIVSSPYLRCIQTVEPLATARGLEVERVAELGEERQTLDGPPFLADVFGDDTVACVHGGIEFALGIHERFKKGAVWLFQDGLERPQILI